MTSVQEGIMGREFFSCEFKFAWPGNISGETVECFRGRRRFARRETGVLDKGGIGTVFAIERVSVIIL